MPVFDFTHTPEKLPEMAAFLLLQDRRFYKWVYKFKKWGTGVVKVRKNRKKDMVK